MDLTTVSVTAAIALFTLVGHLWIRYARQGGELDYAWLRTPLAERDAPFFFKLSIFYLALLSMLPFVYSKIPWLEEAFDKPLLGLIPPGVPLSGALGAVTVSLYGVFGHSHRWKRRYNYWHVARPLMGAVLGSFGYLIFISTIQATGVTPADTYGAPTTSTTVQDSTTTTAGEAPAGPAAPPTDNDRPIPENSVVYFILAFIIGYREETFRELIKRTADLLLKPSGGEQGQVMLFAQPQTGTAPLEVNFTATATASGVADSWVLEFGDGERSTGTGNPTSTMHRYERPGTYIAMLSVTDKAGISTTASVQLSFTSPDATPSDGGATVAVDAGVQRLEAAKDDDEKHRIERELLIETDKFPDADDADNG